jgi:hypothetical protein
MRQWPVLNNRTWSFIKSDPFWSNILRSELVVSVYSLFIRSSKSESKSDREPSLIEGIMNGKWTFHCQRHSNSHEGHIWKSHLLENFGNNGISSLSPIPRHQSVRITNRINCHMYHYIQNIMARECNSRRILFWSEAAICITFHAVYIRLSINYFYFLTKHFPTRDVGFPWFFNIREVDNRRSADRMDTQWDHQTRTAWIHSRIGFCL